MLTTLVWLRHSLRLRDNPAPADAAEHGAVVPVFVWAPEEEGDWPPGGAAQWWLHHALQDLDERLRERGSRLTLRSGPTADALRDIADTTGAARVVWNRRHEPNLARRDANVRTALEEHGLETQIFGGQILHDPDAVETTSGGPYTTARSVPDRCGTRLPSGPTTPGVSTTRGRCSVRSSPASLPFIGSTTTPIRPPKRTATNFATSRGATTPRRWSAGSADRRAIRLLMRACGSSTRPAGYTTASA
ncbi:MAG: hypothetical protein BRD41_05090 [Bacteroidetes bacterium QS_1_63_11]|nr:MAG: hypothetical protein BRD41_05090 [Bacteroidetes bacterium QS_1_63_11]